MASFILCAHNPRIDVLQRVLRACMEQDTTAPYGVCLVDSASSIPITSALLGYDVEIVRVETPGLALARASGIEKATRDPIIFVDDDTILDTDYLEHALAIFCRYPFLGAVGGQLLPEFEGSLPLPERYYRERLAIREFTGEHWSNRWDDFATTPIGGGMVVRRELARAWVRELNNHAWGKTLGRTGTALTGGEDIHLIHTVCSSGFGKGVFEQLKLTHYMPAYRLTPEFLERIVEGNAKSWVLLKALLTDAKAPPSSLRSKVRTLLEIANCRNGLDRKLLRAQSRGTASGWDAVARLRRETMESL
jgi:glycosyltransferase involved in cell wall biosynthesis